jgi:ABC-type uncharacterized transport system ATPase subunit
VDEEEMISLMKFMERLKERDTAQRIKKLQAQLGKLELQNEQRQGVAKVSRKAAQEF